MVKTKPSDPMDSDQRTENASDTYSADYLETIALLQDEVARLEQELQWRDERQTDTTSNDIPSFAIEFDAQGDVDSNAGNSVELERLKAALTSREETVRLLLDELSRVEEVQAAARAEWEHLTDWVAELERRVEGQDGDTVHELENRLAAQEQKTDAIHANSERDRRGWETQRQVYQSEIARLRAALEQAAVSSEAREGHDGQLTERRAPDADLVESLQAENRRLRAAWQELVDRASTDDRCDLLEAKLAESVKARQQLRGQLEQIQDQSKRERLEHEATLAELRAQLTQASLHQAQALPRETTLEGISPALDIDLRIRALRQNLLEVDEREKEERRQKRLISRLSRLWSRTGPR
jgi:hypothetical protein